MKLGLVIGLCFLCVFIGFVWADEVNDNNNENNGVVSRAKNEDCKDKNASGKASDCPLRKDLCKNPVYEQLMKEQCPKTCKVGKCGKKDENGDKEDEDNEDTEDEDNDDEDEDTQENQRIQKNKGRKKTKSKAKNKKAKNKRATKNKKSNKKARSNKKAKNRRQ